jgi:hypothetical protein
MNIVLAFIWIFYLVIIVLFGVAALFVFYHLNKYSFYFRSKNFAIFFFSFFSAGLLIVNFLLFLSIDWAGILRRLAV